jgi:hypothetical protein
MYSSVLVPYIRHITFAPVPLLLSDSDGDQRYLQFLKFCVLICNKIVTCDQLTFSTETFLFQKKLHLSSTRFMHDNKGQHLSEA